MARELRFLLGSRHRAAPGEALVPADGTSSLVHVIESMGIPRTEVGTLLVNGTGEPPTYLPLPGDVVEVRPTARPQSGAPSRYLLDVHLGALTRRMRLLGLDAAYRKDATDAELVDQAIAENRIVLTRDRGLLRRRALPAGALVRGDRPDDQLADVLDRFAPDLSPWSRCPACNGLLAPAPRETVADLLQPGTLRTYSRFSRCRDCGQPYWRGAHSARLEALVAAASVVARRRSRTR